MNDEFDKPSLVILLVCLPLYVVLDCIAAFQIRGLPEPYMAFVPFGLLLQPVSAIGLWNNRKWGIVLLLVSSAISVIGCFGAILVVAIRITRRIETRSQRKKSRCWDSNAAAARPKTTEGQGDGDRVGG